VEFKSPLDSSTILQTEVSILNATATHIKSSQAKIKKKPTEKSPKKSKSSKSAITNKATGSPLKIS
jgi:hypothetical protein